MHFLPLCSSRFTLSLSSISSKWELTLLQKASFFGKSSFIVGLLMIFNELRILLFYLLLTILIFSKSFCFSQSWQSSLCVAILCWTQVTDEWRRRVLGSQIALFCFSPYKWYCMLQHFGQMSQVIHKACPKARLFLYKTIFLS